MSLSDCFLLKHNKTNINEHHILNYDSRCIRMILKFFNGKEILVSKQYGSVEWVSRRGRVRGSGVGGHMCGHLDLISRRAEIGDHHSLECSLVPPRCCMLELGVGLPLSETLQSAADKWYTLHISHASCPNYAPGFVANIFSSIYFSHILWGGVQPEAVTKKVTREGICLFELCIIVAVAACWDPLCLFV